MRTWRLKRIKIYLWKKSVKNLTISQGFQFNRGWSDQCFSLLEWVDLTCQYHPAVNLEKKNILANNHNGQNQQKTQIGSFFLNMIILGIIKINILHWKKFSRPKCWKSTTKNLFFEFFEYSFSNACFIA